MHSVNNLHILILKAVHKVIFEISEDRGVWIWFTEYKNSPFVVCVSFVMGCKSDFLTPQIKEFNLFLLTNSKFQISLFGQCTGRGEVTPYTAGCQVIPILFYLIFSYCHMQKNSAMFLATVMRAYCNIVFPVLILISNFLNRSIVQHIFIILQLMDHR